MSRLGAPGLTASTLANYAAVVGQALRTLLVARLLGPSSFGVLNISNLAANLTTFADVGTGLAGEQRASEARGRGEPQAGRLALRDAAGARMATAYVTLVVCLLGAAVAQAAGLATLALSLAFVGTSAPLQNAAMAARGFLRVTGHFAIVMWAQSAQVAVWLTAVPLAAWQWGLPGAFTAMVGSFLPFLLVASAKAPVLALFAPRQRAFLRLLSQGYRLWLVQISYFLFLNADQLLVALLLGPTATGLYGIAMLGATALVAFSDGAAAAGHVRTLEDVARRGRLTADLPSVTTVMHVVQLGFGLLVPLSWLAMAVLLSQALPDYVPATGAAALLGAAAATTGVVNASNAALLSVGHHRPVPTMLAASTVLKVALVVPAVWLLPDLVAIATCTAIASVVFACLYVRRLSQAMTGTTELFQALVTEHLTGPLLLLLLAGASAAAFELHGMAGFVWAAAGSLAVSGVVHVLTFLRWRQRAARTSTTEPRVEVLIPGGNS